MASATAPAPDQARDVAPQATPAVRFKVVVDTTGSMGSYCAATGSTMQQLFVMLDVLFEGTAHVDIVSYEDYCDGPRLLRSCQGSRAELQAFAAALKAGGGGDAPEAAKTAFNEVVRQLRAQNEEDQGASQRTIVIHYTDAPPHFLNPSPGTGNNDLERRALEDKDPGFDWLRICRAFRDLGTRVVTFTPTSICIKDKWFYALLGDCVVLPETTPDAITKFTMGVLLQLMGQSFEDINVTAFAVAPDISQFEGEEAAFEKTANGLDVVPRAFEPHPALQKDLRCLVGRFKSSEQFKDLVFAALKELFVPEKVLAITYNSVLGALWRLVCTMREDLRLQPLCDALSSCCQALTGSKQEQLRTWVDQSYNQMEEIRTLIRSVPQPFEEGALVLDLQGEDMPTKEEMRSLIHAPIPGVLRKVQALLTRLVVVKQGNLPVEPEEDAPMYVPLALKDQELFATLSHLLLPGLSLSLRPAAMIAILAELSGNALLQPRARRFLEARRGTWIPPIEKAEEYPEILNTEFVRLVVRVPQFLTESERALYCHLQHIIRVRRAAPLKLQVQVGFTPSKAELVPDSKHECGRCHHRRSFTIMEEGTCGLCLSDPEVSPGSVEPAEDRSHMVECRTCQALYAVVRVDLLNVAPKCHYCRNKTPTPVVHCEKCGNKYCCPSKKLGPEGFVCPTCTADATAGTPARDVPLAELIGLNPALMRCLRLPEESRTLVFDRLGLFKLWTQHATEVAAVEAQRPASLVWAGKPVQNVQAVLEQMEQEVLRGRLSGLCNLCFEDRPLPALRSACGRCENMACNDCLRRWYGRLAPGKLYVPSEGLCAFCKRTPQATTLRAFNRLACRLAGRRGLQFDAGMYYAWCRACFRIAEAMPRECAREPPVLQDFECVECTERAQLSSLAKGDADEARRYTRECPGCHAPSTKVSGCDHMTCPVCSAHWCWRCGGKFEEEDIYDHMDKEHGSIGVEGELDFDSE